MKRILMLMALLGFANPANAAMISSDWMTANDGLITTDSISGMEWLDWSHTASRSYDDISSKFGFGMEFHGFRYATQMELTELYTNVGFTFPTNVGSSNVSIVPDFLSFFGVTASGARIGTGTEAIYDLSITSGKHAVAVAYSTGVVLSFLFEASDNLSDSFTGSALVRVAAVPVPAALPLFGTGLAVMGLLGWRRKRKTS